MGGMGRGRGGARRGRCGDLIPVGEASQKSVQAILPLALLRQPQEPLYIAVQAIEVFENVCHTRRADLLLSLRLSIDPELLRLSWPMNGGV